MKITNIEVFLLTEWRNFLFVRVDTDADISGWGEAGITNREWAVAGCLRHLESLIVGQSPFNSEHLWQLCWRSGFFPAGQILSAAIAAVDIALWDIKGKALGVPVYQLLGGKTRERVLTYRHLSPTPQESLFANARQAIEEGWEALRWEPALVEGAIHDPAFAISTGLEQWRQMRDLVGQEVALCYDMHTRLAIPDAIRMCRLIEEFAPFFVEDPVRSEHASGYEKLVRHCSVPLAAGEQYANKWQFRELIEKELIDYARVDLCVAGGITEAMKIAALAEAHLIDVAVHNPIGPISTAACAHFNTAITNMGIMELPRLPGETMSSAVATSCTWRHGYLTVDDSPGLGIQVDVDRFEQFVYRADQMPSVRKQDGSFNNW